MKTRAVILLLVVSSVFGILTPLTVDYIAFYQAGRAILSGLNPYTAHVGYYNPLYVAAAYTPLSLLPFEVAYRVQAGLMLFVYVIALWRMVRRRDLLFVALCGPFALMSALYGNLEAWVLLGITLPTPIGLWLVLSKPQIGLFAAAVMVANDARTRGWHKALLMTAPVTVVYAISIAFGMFQVTPAQAEWNVSLWPWGLLVGGPLAIYALRRRDAALGLLASALSAPYLAVISWGAIQPALSRRRLAAISATVIGWAIYGVWRVRVW